MSHDLNYLRWRDQTRRDLSRTFGILALLAVIVWTATSISAEGAATLPTHATPTTPTPATTSIWLTTGSSGDDVTTVQTILAHHGWSLAVDGDYGPITEAIVTRFQAASGLLADGIVGPVTWNALASVAPAPAVRGTSVQVAAPPPPAATSTSSDAKCPQWWDTARQAGWPEDYLPRLDLIMYRESRCDPNVLNDSYLRGGGDYSFGLVQINVKPGAGTQPFFGPLLDWDWSRLYDPLTNLQMGLAMGREFESKSWGSYCFWKPWTTRNTDWC